MMPGRPSPRTCADDCSMTARVTFKDTTWGMLYADLHGLRHPAAAEDPRCAPRGGAAPPRTATRVGTATGDDAGEPQVEVLLPAPALWRGRFRAADAAPPRTAIRVGTATDDDASEPQAEVLPAPALWRGRFRAAGAWPERAAPGRGAGAAAPRRPPGMRVPLARAGGGAFE
ncbi:unnamed protein product [Prorocentrum cordatum]|uniref:Uncharacterized protein n=1 Tax=Prorocentrum cordatum TaxID=2364126 RepID=A0ABN9VTM3_9DINO|nr:unnamed protein product [Polarella glacialis]